MNNYEYIITATRAYCGKCNSEYIKKYGRTDDGRQIIKCLDCNKKTTLNARKFGEQAFQRHKLLPIHWKDPDLLTPGELYSMGFIIADGSLSKTHQLSITINPNDVEVLNIIKRELVIDNPVGLVQCYYVHKRTKERKKGWYSRLTWAYKYAPAYWNALGLCSDKTGNEIWMSYMGSPHFLRGLWDGDGGFSLSEGGKLRAYYSVLSKDYCENVRDYIRSRTGYTVSISFSNGCFNLHYFNRAAIAIGDLLYDDSAGLRLNRKYLEYSKVKYGL